MHHRKEYRVPGFYDNIKKNTLPAVLLDIAPLLDLEQ